VCGMFRWFRFVVGLARAVVKCRRHLLLENIALRHQLLVLSRKAKPGRRTPVDRALWVSLLLTWHRWTSVLSLVQRYRRALAPAGFPAVLALEESGWETRPKARRSRNGRAHPADVPKQSVMGCATHSRRIGQAGDPCRPANRRQIHGAASASAQVADLD
jgi:hypothetical protein